MKIVLREFITPEEFAICSEISKKRANEHISDFKQGDKRASYSFGQAGKMDDRTYDQRFDDSIMGCFGELISSKVAKCPWTKEMGQYKGNHNPDLQVTYQGKIFKCEVRGTRHSDAIIYRQRDHNRPNDILIAITNLPRGPVCKVGWAFFRDLQKHIETNPQWKGPHAGASYYWVPVEYLNDDFSEFGV